MRHVKSIRTIKRAFVWLKGRLEKMKVKDGISDGSQAAFRMTGR